MKKELKLIEIKESEISKFIPDNYKFLINYPKKPTNYNKLVRLMKSLENDHLSPEACCDKAKIAKSTYYKIVEMAERAYNYCEEKEIDYENTIFAELINCGQNLVDSYNKGIESDTNAIMSAGYDIIEQDIDENGNKKSRLVKKGDWKAIAHVMQYKRKREFGSIDAEQKQAPPSININIDLGGRDLKEMAMLSQKNLIDSMNQKR